MEVVGVIEVALRDVVLDYSLYPRKSGVDFMNVRRLVNAIEAGRPLPPIVVDEASHRVVDGFHRCTAYKQALGEDTVLRAEVRRYESDAELFEEAAEINSSHGQPLSSFDKAHCLLLGEKLGIDPDRLAYKLSLTRERYSHLKLTKQAISPDGTPVPIRRTVRHLAGEMLTERQHEAAEHVSGKPQLWHCTQLLNLLQGDLLDKSNQLLAQRLDELTVALRIAGYGAEPAAASA